MRGGGRGDGATVGGEERDGAVEEHAVAKIGGDDDTRRVKCVVAGAGERLVEGAEDRAGWSVNGEAEFAAVGQVGADFGDADGDDAVRAGVAGGVGDAVEDDVRCPFDGDAVAVRAGHDNAVTWLGAENRERIAGHGGEHRLGHVGVGVGVVEGDGVGRRGRRHHKDASGDGAGAAVAVGVHVAAVRCRAALEEVLEAGA